MIFIMVFTGRVLIFILLVGFWYRESFTCYCGAAFIIIFWDGPLSGIQYALFYLIPFLYISLFFPFCLFTL